MRTVRAKNKTVGKHLIWDEAHVRVTFHCPKTLLELLNRQVQRGGKSKSRLIVDALAKALRWKRPRAFP